MTIARKYTHNEINGILKTSENASVPGHRGKGHAEGLHTITPVGRKQQHTTEKDLARRVQDERKEIVGAFTCEQDMAITDALNCKVGQTALGQ